MSTSVKHIRNCFSAVVPEYLSIYLFKTLNLTFFELDSVMLGDLGIENLYQGLTNNESVESISLRNNMITDESSKAIYGIMQIKHLKNLIIDENPLKDKFKQKFSDLCQINPVLGVKCVSMKNCGFTDKCAKQFFVSLNLSNSIIEFNCEKNSINSEENSSMIYLFQDNHQLGKLFFGKCDLSDNAITHISYGMSLCFNLKVLDFKCNYIGDVGAFALAKSLRSHPGNLSKLDLSYNKIKNEGAKSLIELLSFNSNLEYISIVANHINSEIGKFIIDNIYLNKKIKVLNLKLNNIDLKFIDTIEKIVSKNKKRMHKNTIHNIKGFLNDNNKESNESIPNINREAQRAVLFSNKIQIEIENEQNEFSLKSKKEINLREGVSKSFEIIRDEVKKIQEELNFYDRQLKNQEDENNLQFGKKNEEIIMLQNECNNLFHLSKI